MQTIFDLRGAEVTDTPLLVFDCVLPNGQTEHWSTHAVSAGGNAYAARVLQHTIFEIQTASDQLCGWNPAHLYRAGQCRLALLGDRTSDRLEGLAADGRIPVLRLAQRRAADRYFRDLSRRVQSAGRDS